MASDNLSILTDSFEYLTPKRRLDPEDLCACSPNRQLPRWIHAICSPDRIEAIVGEAHSISKRHKQPYLPRIVWEPIPDSAKPQNLDGMVSAAGLVDVIRCATDALRRWSVK